MQEAGLIVTESASPEHDTSTASASLLSVKVLMPSIQEKLGILNNNCLNVGHLIRAKASHFAYRPAWATWMCGGSRPSMLKKRTDTPGL